ncbi:MAG: hypothetical protein KF745_06830 [Phycisphaeraceae bacterium]|nr:hypothetical protein [Phycisphaeraceae bacterium]
MNLPIGELLVKMGHITDKQRRFILEKQKASGRPFGDIAEESFGISARAVEAAWAEQYSELTRHVDPTLEQVDSDVLPLITRRQAWQFRVLPLRYEGGSLLVCTTRDHLVRALNFATAHIDSNVFFVLSEPEALGEGLLRYYPMDGMTPQMVRGQIGRSDATR